MKGKYRRKKSNIGLYCMIALVVLLAVTTVVLWLVGKNRENPTMPGAETTEAAISSDTTESTVTPTETTAELEQPFQRINLGYGVYLERANHYTGTYMEDGSDQMVSGVMMIRVHNTGENDVQLMQIEVAYPNETYQFQVTNLPAGASAVLLELSKKAKPEGDPVSAVASNVVLFNENMKFDDSVFAITGADGMMNVKNISGADITGDIYVYYKYKTQDLFYGGITFRVTLEGGLKSGETRQLMTSHYNPSNCQVVMVDTVEQDGN